MYFVYVLKSLKTKEYYKGLTNNIDERIKEHLSGKAYSTKSMLPLKLVHAEVCETRLEGRKIEKFFKSGLEEKL